MTVVRLSSPKAIITPPLTMLCYAVDDIYPIVGRFDAGRLDPRLAWQQIALVMRGHLNTTFREPYQESQIICDELMNPPELVEQKKVCLRLAIKTAAVPDFYASDFTLSRVEAGVLDVEERRPHG